MALGGIRGRSSRDFGLSGNLTLPGSDLRDEFTSEPTFMPEEKKGRKKHAQFAVEHEPTALKQDEVPKQKRRLSMADRIRRLFRRSTRKRTSPYEGTSSSIQKGSRKGIRKSESDPQLATIPEQSEDEGEKEGRTEGEREQIEGEALPRKKKRTPNRRVKAQSTAFEHTSSSTYSSQKAEPVVTMVHLTLKTKELNSGLHKVVLQHREDMDSLGLHLSGGLPPVTITYLEPGGQAEKAGVKVGDVLLDVNGLNCRKKVEIAQLMRFKIMIQEPPKENMDKQEQADAAALDKIKARQNELDMEKEIDLKVTSIDSASDEEPGIPHVMKAKPKKKKKDKDGRPKRRSAEIGDPLATSSPMREDGTSSQKKESSSSLAADEKPKEEDPRVAKRRSKKKTTSADIEGSDPVKKRIKKKVPQKDMSLSVDVESIPAKASPEEEKNAPQQEERSTVQEEEVFNLKKNDRIRRSASPKSRYHTGGADAAATGEDSTDAGVVIGVIVKKKAADKESGKDKEKRKKKTESTPAEKKAKKKVTKKKSEGESKEVPAEHVEEKKEEAPLLSAAVSGSFESDTIEYVPKNKSSSGSLKRASNDKKKDPSTSSLKREKKKKEDKATSESKSATSSRRSSVDQGSLGHSLSHSQSYSGAENQKRFREDLKEASKSEYDMAGLDASLDPNIKIKKSGVVKEGKSSLRPSIFNQSSSPEPEEESASSLGVTGDGESREDENLLDADFKEKKSGVLVGKKAARPSILDDTPPKDAFTDVQPGEIKYNKEVEMDLSSVPQITPSLGLVAGRDRRDASNRSLTKRRPPTLRQNSEQDKAQSPELKGEPGTSRTAAARKLFENQNQKQDDSKWRFGARPTSVSKSVEKPIKTFGEPKPTQTKTVTKVEDKPQAHPTTAWTNGRSTKTQSIVVSDTGTAATPSWVVLAQGRQKRASMIETKPKPSGAPTNATTSTSASNNSSGPAMGSVAQRLAMFQNQNH